MLLGLRKPRFSYPSKLLSHRAGLSQQAAGGGQYVLGCGSNVVDHIYNVQVVPRAGEKGFFRSNFKALETKLVGGVTLNHLSWAALGRVPTGLLALQGDDDMGHFICSGLQNMGVSTEFIRVDEAYSTAQCHVFIQEGGERSILMAPAATSLINAQAVNDYFDQLIQSHASMVTTEISQVPLSGVLEILRAAKRAGVLSVLDLDVPPTVAVEEAKLGTLEEVLECVRMADILKPAKAAAQDVLKHLSPSSTRKIVNDLAQSLVELCGSKLVALTDGSSGSVIATRDNVVMVEAPRVGSVVDTTGAGDAFLGGLICGITTNGLPKTSNDIEVLGRMGNAFGAACVQSVGGVPVESSRALLQEYLPEMKFEVDREQQYPVSSSSGSAAWLLSLDRDSQAAVDLMRSSTAVQAQWTTVVDTIDKCSGRMFVSGLGKSGHVAHRLAASLSSVGISAEFVHAAEWAHGDLGKTQPGDVCLFLSHSGKTTECVNVASLLSEKGASVVSITGTTDNPLSSISKVYLGYSSVTMEEPFGLLPTSSIVLQEMVCNGLLCELMSRRRVTLDDFKKNHPGGTIGAQLNRN